MENNLVFLKELNIELPYDPAILLQDVYSKELKMDTQILIHECSEQHYSQLPKVEITQMSINR